jgi:hypothetical protein
MRKLLAKTIIVSTFVFSTLSIINSKVSAQSASLYFSPSSYSVATNQSVAVKIMVNSGGENINGVTADFTYPSQLLEVVSIDATDSIFSIEAEQTYDTTTVYISRGTTSSYSGTGEIATVNFRSISNGTATLSFTDDVLVTSADTSLDILGATNEGTITIGSVPATGFFDKPALLFTILTSLLLAGIGSLGVLQYFKEKKVNKLT